jgi:hypothetical protein
VEPDIAFFNALKQLGVDARITERSEQKHGLAVILSLLNPKSWLTGPGMDIEIDGGPISAVRLWNESPPKSESYDPFTDYLVADGRIDNSLRMVSLRTSMTTRFPIVGDYVDVHWKGNDRRLGIIEGLTRDELLKKQLLEGRVDDLTIQANPKRRAWVLRRVGWQPPSPELWSCYQAIGRHLLDAPIPARR